MAVLQVRRAQIGRLLRLIVLLQGEGRPNTTELSRSLGVSRRTIFRDLETLEGAGIAIEYSEELRGYALKPGTNYPLVGWGLDEAAALIIQLKLAAGRSPEGLATLGWQAIRTGLDSLASPLKTELLGLGAMIEVEGPDRPAPISEGLAQEILRASAHRLRLRVRLRDEAPFGRGPLGFEVHRILVSDHDWRLLGHLPGRPGTLTIAASRIEQAEATEIPYTIPAQDAAPDRPALNPRRHAAFAP